MQANLNFRCPHPSQPHAVPTSHKSPHSLFTSESGELDTWDCSLTPPVLSPHVEPFANSCGFHLLSCYWMYTPLSISITVPPWLALMASCLGFWPSLVHPAARQKFPTCSLMCHCLENLSSAFLLFKKYILLIMLLQLSHFPPLHSPPPCPPLPSHIPPHSLIHVHGSYI